jgi:hypothetical protein
MDEVDALRAELEHYRAEKEKIRDVVGQIGGKNKLRWQRVINLGFLLLVTGAFGFDVLRSAMDWQIRYLPPLVLLEVAVLLVSLKIIWMIHMQSKVDHFQFWILTSLEFQMSMLSKRLDRLSDALEGGASDAQPADSPAGDDAGGGQAG